MADSANTNLEDGSWAVKVRLSEAVRADDLASVEVILTSSIGYFSRYSVGCYVLNRYFDNYLDKSFTATWDRENSIIAWALLA